MQTLNATFTGLKVWQPFWDEFLAGHAAWLEDRLVESGELFFVPISHTSVAFTSTFGAYAGDIAVEESLTRLCREFKIIGIRVADARKTQSSSQLIRYEGLEAPAGPPI